MAAAERMRRSKPVEDILLERVIKAALQKDKLVLENQ